MAAYRLYHVMTGKLKQGGSIQEANKWWREKGAPDILSEPWTKSLRVYLAQFGLGGEWELEVWREIDDYAALDKVDAWYAEDPEGAKKRDDLWNESAAYFEWGPCRLMGDYPESAE
jgi:hypothetical protein